MTCHTVLYVSSVLFTTIFLSSAMEDNNHQDKALNRTGRVFSLFSIVQFPNSACSSTSSSYSNGTCFTASECSSKGGSAQGNCAAGFGVCCVFSVSTSLSSVNQNCTYIVNPGYPSNYVPTTQPTTVSYTINKCSADICRIRLDYDLFVLTAPNAVQATQGQCDTDVMTMTTTAQTVAQTTTSYGPYPYLCGTNTGYHSYLDVSNTAADTATIAFTIGDTTNNQWKIKVTQYSCNDDYVACQTSCFQYHTGVTGTIQSYNLAGAAQLQGQNYKHCIRREEGYCCIQYTVITYAISLTTCADAAGNRCSGASVCTTDYILIPNAITSGIVSYDRFCGVNLNSVGFPNTNVPIITCDLPFEVSHVTGTTSVGSGGGDAKQTGFSINYSQVAGNC